MSAQVGSLPSGAGQLAERTTSGISHVTSCPSATASQLHGNPLEDSVQQRRSLKAAVEEMQRSMRATAPECIPGVQMVMSQHVTPALGSRPAPAAGPPAAVPLPSTLHQQHAQQEAPPAAAAATAASLPAPALAATATAATAPSLTSALLAQASSAGVNRVAFSSSVVRTPPGAAAAAAGPLAGAHASSGNLPQPRRTPVCDASPQPPPPPPQQQQQQLKAQDASLSAEQLKALCPASMYSTLLAQATRLASEARTGGGSEAGAPLGWLPSNIPSADTSLPLPHQITAPSRVPSLCDSSHGGATDDAAGRGGVGVALNPVPSAAVGPITYAVPALAVQQAQEPLCSVLMPPLPPLPADPHSGDIVDLARRLAYDLRSRPACPPPLPDNADVMQAFGSLAHAPPPSAAQPPALPYHPSFAGAVLPGADALPPHLSTASQQATLFSALVPALGKPDVWSEITLG